MGEDKTLKADGEADVAAAHHVLDLEVQELGLHAQGRESALGPPNKPRLGVA